MSQTANIPCPECSTPIPFDVKSLLSGAKIICPNCFAHLAIAEDAKSSMQEALDKFEKLKKKQ